MRFDRKLHVFFSAVCFVAALLWWV
jgi:hypothetical protein